MSTRQLRSQTLAEKRHHRSGTTYGALDRPVKRQRKPEPVHYQCHTCDERKLENQFPDYNPSSECEHEIHTCTDCLRIWVNVQIRSRLLTAIGDDNTFGIRCPECPAVMRNVNVQMATDPRMRLQFEEIVRRHIANNTPGWFWCLYPDCNAGKVHDSTEQTNICICHRCGAYACAPCNRPFHQGETCSAYQARIKDRIEEEDRSLQTIRSRTRKCPRCKVNIEKNGGCSSMFCKQDS
ncbi:uncharacterized protein K460DRAFT_429560 [Cucurbitaria berberidis CBS 394.84]|uniref:RBR-type E3 ubiquitin transferase n=1 Tax=Cucurbitaria berberidis CBS 394.84 TaxID=1168544 RepID=A0A9P4L825_9PLEO|nr:uncharacterized protein K460DRAFT_429560 [Cucurbitaria berberidis CBS 394.84]KAF1844793.1 hypothetical protein K460DRAFT_429560 [Cucurbitaria berberidis CBS 394.84]